MVIAITGVTGKLGGIVAKALSEEGLMTRHLARSPERAKSYPNATIVKAAYEYSPETVAALRGA